VAHRPTDLCWHQLRGSVRRDRLHYDGAGGKLKGTYTVAPGADPAQIRWRYRGVEQVRVEQATGDVRITVAVDQILTEAAPIAWQDIAGQRVPVDTRYHVAADGAIGFALGTYNTAYPLIIDPTIEWSTYLGGSIGSSGRGIAIDGQGNVYVTGGTASPDFPLQDPLQAELGGGFSDAFITKYSPDGQTLIYSTYFGGPFPDIGQDIAVDADGKVYIAGDVTLESEPDPNSPCFPGVCVDMFVAKLITAAPACSYQTNTESSGAVRTAAPPSHAGPNMDDTTIPAQEPVLLHHWPHNCWPRQCRCGSASNAAASTAELPILPLCRRWSRPSSRFWPSCTPHLMVVRSRCPAMRGPVPRLRSCWRA
jgi:hypothetical protein